MVYNTTGFAYYRHSDWLGSSRVASTNTHTVHYDGPYAPFGENYAETGTTDRSFTGQTQDTVRGENDFLFRQQSPGQGRWLVPDPAGLAAVDITNPQTWNRYAYVGNSPLSNVDPLGLLYGTGIDLSSLFQLDCGGDFCDFNWIYPIWPISGGGGGGGHLKPPRTPGTPAAKPPVLRHGQPQCFAQLKTRGVNDTTAQLFGGTHSFWYVQDTLGNQYTVSGGPDALNNASLDVWINPNVNSGVDNVSATTSWNSGLSADNCNGSDNLMTAAGIWPQGTIPYSPYPGPNSNTVANYLGTQGGFSPPKPFGAYGWNAPLPPSVPNLLPVPQN